MNWPAPEGAGLEAGRSWMGLALHLLGLPFSLHEVVSDRALGLLQGLVDRVLVGLAVGLGLAVGGGQLGLEHLDLHAVPRDLGGGVVALGVLHFQIVLDADGHVLLGEGGQLLFHGGPVAPAAVAPATSALVVLVLHPVHLAVEVLAVDPDGVVRAPATASAALAALAVRPGVLAVHQGLALVGLVGDVEGAAVGDERALDVGVLGEAHGFAAEVAPDGREGVGQLPLGDVAEVRWGDEDGLGAALELDHEVHHVETETVHELAQDFVEALGLAGALEGEAHDAAAVGEVEGVVVVGIGVHGALRVG